MITALQTRSQTRRNSPESSAAAAAASPRRGGARGQPECTRSAEENHTGGEVGNGEHPELQCSG